MRGHCGQGLSEARPGGGLGSSSKLTTEVAPWRMAVPMQSLPVSPPPMTITFLPRASMPPPAPPAALARQSWPTAPPSSSALVLRCRNSMARWMPLSSRPGMFMSRATVAPVDTHSASKSRSSSSGDGAASDPTTRPAPRGCAAPPMLPAAPVRNEIPSLAMRSTRRCTTPSLSAFMLGTPYMMRPPTRSARSNTVTRWPALLSWSAQARPAGPEPMTATFLPVRVAGGRGTIQPSSKALSMMEHSMFLIVTGCSMMPSTQAPSQGAGHTRPVNSGKLLVASRRCSAAFHWPSYTSSFHSGILLPRGQPVAFWWQKGTPQFMQRAPCVLSFSSSRAT
mmetsp:Transcript_5348/g.17312  ORF Transcript_5348/g.17312 Transcript_5348/m.17312 type:complete len:337 (-) Transcript_5348:5050-6060(-)